MAKILPLPVKPTRFGFEKVKKRSKKKADPADYGQLDLFSTEVSTRATILTLPTQLSPFEQALLLDEKGEDNRAVDAYLNAIESGDCAADAYCNLGILEFKAGKISKAFDCFSKSLQENPRHFEAHYNLANLYFEMEDLNLARYHYEIAAEIDPDFPNLYFNLGLVLALLEDYEAALQAFSRYQSLSSEEEASKAAELIKTLEESLAIK